MDREPGPEGAAGSRPGARPRARFTPRLRTVLVLSNLMLLLFPLGGVVLLRLYESVLVRRTESELQAQGVVVAAAFRTALARERREGAARGAGAGAGAEPGRRPAGAPCGRALPPALRAWWRQRFRPLVPRLDLARDPVRRDAEPSRAPVAPPDAAAVAAGRTLDAVLREVQASTLAGIRVVDWRGTVVASTRGELGRSLAHREEVGRALAGSGASLLRRRPPGRVGEAGGALRRAAAIRVFVALPVVLEDRVVGAVVLSRTPPSVWQTIERRRGLFLGGAAAALALVIALSLFTAWTVARPLRALADQAARLARGEREAALELARPGTREVRDLSRAFVNMARALDERAAYIRTFAASVSHEFKTPLTGIRGAVELLRDHLDEMTPEEREGFLANLEGDAARLERLVRGLVELARAEVSRAGPERADPVAVARQVAARFAAEGLDVALEPTGGAADAAAGGGDGPSFAVPLPAPALESVLGSLLENARQHGAAPVRVRIAADGEGAGSTEPRRVGAVVIDVVDAGPGISEANLPRVFDRFFTTARDRGGSGLGLAIVRALVEAHGGEVACGSRPGETRFTVRLPLA